MSPERGEAITFSLPVSIGSVQNERVLTIEWLRDKLAEGVARSRRSKGRLRAGTAWPTWQAGREDPEKQSSGS
jgi:hypothetical protein